MSEDQKVDAWMPLWIGAYMADTMTLTTQQHGAYLLLLFAYWRNRGPLADDDEDLAAITKASPAEWRKLRAKMTRFFDVADGKWTHGRADKELADAGLRKANAVSKAKAAAEARWKKSGKQCNKDAPSMLQALREDCPTPSPTSSIPTVQKKARAAPPPAVDRPADVGEDVWRDWLALRKAKKAPVSPTVLAGAVAEAAKAGMSLEAFLRVWCTRGTQGLQADWLKPHERQAQKPPIAAEPAWRSEQRQRTAEFAGPYAAKPAANQPATEDLHGLAISMD